MRLIELIHDIEDGRRPLDWKTLDALAGALPAHRLRGMKVSLRGRRAMVTGAGHGFGRAIAMAFVGSAVRVWACDINAEGLKATREVIGRNCETRTVDVSDPKAVAAFVAEAAGAAPWTSW